MSDQNLKQQKIQSILNCPKCQAELRFSIAVATCTACAYSFPIVENYIYKTIDTAAIDEKQTDAEVFFIKSFLKKFPRLYKILCHTIGGPPVGIAPVTFIKCFASEKIILNIGSGSKFIRSDIINIDLSPHKNIDVVADATELPIKDGTVDVVICESLIEHLPDSSKLIAEMLRILNNNGYLYLVSPFMLGFHASPNDYYRWTDQGLRQLLNNFKDIDIRVIYGPATAFANMASEWFAILLSFNLRFLYVFWLLLFLTILSPLKLLDFLLVKYKNSSKIAMGFVAIAKK